VLTSIKYITKFHVQEHGDKLMIGKIKNEYCEAESIQRFLRNFSKPNTKETYSELP
jgi:hypothetical protein